MPRFYQSPYYPRLLPCPRDNGATQSRGDEYEASRGLEDATQQSPQRTSPSPVQQPPAAFDRGIASERIIDFKRNLTVGDLVTKAVGDICFVQREKSVKPMANRRKDEFLECLQYLGKMCLKVRIILTLHFAMFTAEPGE